MCGYILSFKKAKKLRLSQAGQAQAKKLVKKLVKKLRLRLLPPL
jgi:hypothetical protein